MKLPYPNYKGVKLGGKINSINNPTYIPDYQDALYILSGLVITIGANKYLKDISGNNRHFLITGMDYDDSFVGVPYKCNYTISAPAGDATLIAGDVNNFLYDSGGTPNQLAVQDLYQNIQHDNIIYHRHIAQTVDDTNDVEVGEPRVVDLVMYSSARTGASLTACDAYFGTPALVAGSYWLDPLNGDNSYAGTHAAPWKTVATKMANGRTLYMKNGFDDYGANSLTIDKTVTIIGTGRCGISCNNASMIVYVYVAGGINLTGLRIFRSANTSQYGIYCPTTLGFNSVFTKLKIYNVSVTGIYKERDHYIYYNYCNTGISHGAGAVINTCRVAFNTTYAGVKGMVIKNCKLVAGSNSSVTHNVGNILIKGCVDPLSGGGSLVISAGTQLELYYNNLYRNNFSGTAYNISIPFIITQNRFRSTEIGTAGNSLIKINGAISGSIYSNVIDTYGTNNYQDIDIAGDTASISTVNIYDNKIIHRGLTGYAIKCGAESGAIRLLQPRIYRNAVMGALYVNPAIVPATSAAHMIYVGMIENYQIIDNYTEGGSPGIAIKGNNSVDGALGKCYGNICKDNNNNYIVQGMLNVALYNNVSIQTLAINRHFSFGEATTGINANTKLKNCIAYGLSATINAISIAEDSEVGFESDYNCIYIPNRSNWMSHPDGYNSLAAWQAAGFDIHSVFEDPDLLGSDNFYPLLDALKGYGLDLSAEVDNLLDISTDFQADNLVPAIVETNFGNHIGAYKLI